MQKVAPPAPATRPLWMVILAAGLIVGIAMGLRQVMGLYLPPMTKELGIGREPFSTAMAIANLVWGLGAVFAGMVADRYGAGRVVVGGHAGDAWPACTACMRPDRASTCWSAASCSASASAAPGSPRWSAPSARAAPPEKRTSAIAALGMASGIGGFVAFPYTHLLMDLYGWQTSLLLLLATTAVVMPLAWPLAGKPRGSSA